MKKIAVMTDSSADLSQAEAEANHLFVLRMPMMVQERQYIEETEIKVDELIRLMRQGAIVKTSQPVLGSLLTMWDEILEEYDEILYIPLSSQLSGSYATAKASAAGYEGRITVVDAKFACYPLAWLCIEAQKMLAAGLSCAQVKQKIENETELWAALIPDDLVYLKRGGRISAAAAALGNLLKIVPVLKVEHGGIDVLDKVRTSKKALSRGLEAALDVPDPENYVWMVVDTDQPEMAAVLKQKMEERTGQPVTIHQMHAVVMAHTGPGTLGYGRMRKLKY